MIFLLCVCAFGGGVRVHANVLICFLNTHTHTHIRTIKPDKDICKMIIHDEQVPESSINVRTVVCNKKTGKQIFILFTRPPHRSQQRYPVNTSCL